MAKIRVLLIDDDEDITDVIALNLKDHGYEVEVAHDGREGLVKVAAFKPNVILLDVMMPIQDGYETCKKLKASPETKDIPVIMLTSVAAHVPDSQYSHHDMLEIEADDYVPKPVQPDVLLQIIEKWK